MGTSRLDFNNEVTNFLVPTWPNFGGLE